MTRERRAKPGDAPRRADRLGVTPRAGAVKRESLGGLARRVFGLHRRAEVEGVRYRERHLTPLDRALSARGKGWKQYEVRFPTGRSMSIRATASRRYADLMDVPELRSLRAVEKVFRPGCRVLILGCGTGALAAKVSGWIGPSGGIVAVEHDNESIRFARRRYPLPHASFERGGLETLAGEVDGAFEIVVLCEGWLRGAEDTGAAVGEAWRVTGERGRLVMIGDRSNEHFLRLAELGAGRASRLTPTDGAPMVVVIPRPARRREQEAGGAPGEGGA